MKERGFEMDDTDILEYEKKEVTALFLAPQKTTCPEYACGQCTKFGNTPTGH